MKRIIYKPVLGLPFLITVVLLTTQCVDHQAEIPYLTTEVSLVEASASQTSVMLSFNSNVQWKVDFESAWLTSGGIKYGENDGLLEFTLQPNEGVDQRECIVTVSAVSAALEELAFTLRQSGTAPVLSCLRDTLKIAQTSVTEKVPVSSNVDWTAASDAGWVSLSRRADTLVVACEGNDVSNVRSAMILVSSATHDIQDTVIVLQEAKTPPFLNVEPEYSLAYYAGTEVMPVGTNVDYTVESTAGWLAVEKSDGGILLTYEANDGIQPRSADIILSAVGESLGATVKVTQEGMPLTERQADSLALVTFFNNTAGEQWKNTWDLPQPMSSWYGVVLTEEGRVRELNLWENNIVGELGDCLTVLDEAVQMHFGGGNNLTGTLSPKFAQLHNLQMLAVQNNNMEGSIPAEFGSMVNLVNFYIDGNRFSGEIPEEILNCPNWPGWESSGFRRQQEGYGFTN